MILAAHFRGMNFWDLSSWLGWSTSTIFSCWCYIKRLILSRFLGEEFLVGWQNILKTLSKLLLRQLVFLIYFSIFLFKYKCSCTTVKSSSFLHVLNRWVLTSGQHHVSMTTWSGQSQLGIFWKPKCNPSKCPECSFHGTCAQKEETQRFQLLLKHTGSSEELSYEPPRMDVCFWPFQSQRFIKDLIVML